MPYAPQLQKGTSESSKFLLWNNAADDVQLAQQAWDFNAATLSGTTGKYLEKELSLWRMSRSNGVAATEDNPGAKMPTLCSLRDENLQNEQAELIGGAELQTKVGDAKGQQDLPLKRSRAKSLQLTTNSFHILERPGKGAGKEITRPNDAAKDQQHVEVAKDNYFNTNAVTLSAMSGEYLQKELSLWQSMRSESLKDADANSCSSEPLSPLSPVSPVHKRHRKQRNEEEDLFEMSAATLSGTTGKFLAKELQHWRQEKVGLLRVKKAFAPCDKKETEIPSPAAEQSTDEGSSDSVDDSATESPPFSPCSPTMEHIHVPRTAPEVDALIFDLDDTLYTVSCGFSDHRNAEVTVKFLVEEVGFHSYSGAKALRDEYFQRYHSTLKGLSIASREGKLPRPFNELELGEYWTEHCNFEKYLKPDPLVIEALRTLRDDGGLTLVAFTNSPVKYGLRCLDFLGLRGIFEDRHVFGIEDVLPAAKPERAAFEKVLKTVGLRADRTVMFEDSMKNIKACKAMGMHTVLVSERAGGSTGGEAALLDDLPSPDDPAVDVVVRRISQMRTAIPGLWSRRF